MIYIKNMIVNQLCCDSIFCLRTEFSGIPAFDSYNGHVYDRKSKKFQ